MPVHVPGSAVSVRADLRCRRRCVGATVLCGGAGSERARASLVAVLGCRRRSSRSRPRTTVWPLVVVGQLVRVASVAPAMSSQFVAVGVAALPLVRRRSTGSVPVHDAGVGGQRPRRASSVAGDGRRRPCRLRRGGLDHRARRAVSRGSRHRRCAARSRPRRRYGRRRRSRECILEPVAPAMPYAVGAVGVAALPRVRVSRSGPCRPCVRDRPSGSRRRPPGRRPRAAARWPAGSGSTTSDTTDRAVGSAGPTPLVAVTTARISVADVGVYRELVGEAQEGHTGDGHAAHAVLVAPPPAVLVREGPGGRRRCPGWADGVSRRRRVVAKRDDRRGRAWTGAAALDDRRRAEKDLDLAADVVARPGQHGAAHGRADVRVGGACRSGPVAPTMSTQSRAQSSSQRSHW